MNVIGKEKYFHKRITNALVAKAVEICAAKGISYLNYGEYGFPGKKESSLTTFKRRNGFEAFKLPRYYVRITNKGKLALKLGLHRETNTFVPWPFMKVLLSSARAITSVSDRIRLRCDNLEDLAVCFS